MALMLNSSIGCQWCGKNCNNIPAAMVEKNVHQIFLIEFYEKSNTFWNSDASYAGKQALKLNIIIDNDGKGFEGRGFTF